MSSSVGESKQMILTVRVIPYSTVAADHSFDRSHPKMSFGPLGGHEIYVVRCFLFLGGLFFGRF